MGMQNQMKRTIAHILNIICSVYFTHVLLGLKYGRGLTPTAKVSNRNIYEIAERRLYNKQSFCQLWSDQKTT
jgi:hypothetical protein